MRMIRLLYVEAGGEKKQSAGRLDASEGGEDFCWMLFQLSARSLSLPLSLQHKHTSIAFFFFYSHNWLHVSIQMLCKFPSGLKTHCGHRENQISCSLAAPSRCYNQKYEWMERIQLLFRKIWTKLCACIVCARYPVILTKAVAEKTHSFQY